MNISVCDDSPLDRETIIFLLHNYFSDKSIAYEITEFQSGANLLYEVESQKHFDLVFLDIYMDDFLGIDIARKLREIGYGGDIVFITASDRFALEGYEVSASAYLLKPHSSAKLNAAMEKILSRRRPDTYNIMRRGNMIRILYNEILYIESSNSKCTLHSTDGCEYVIYKRLSEIAAELNDRRFLRCHQSYIVNMSFIVQAEKEFVLSTGDVILIRQRSLNEIKREYFNYIGNNERTNTSITKRCL